MSQTPHPASHQSFTSFRADLAARANTPAHKQWLKDREIRHAVRLSEAWRGCVGLAAMFEKPEESINHGELCLLPNDNLKWLAMRDVPIGHFPGSQPMNRRDVNFVTTSVAKLRHGMPVIDFRESRESWDFKFMPFDLYRRPPGETEVATLTELGFAADVLPPDMVKAVGDTLNVNDNPREFAVLNAVSERMTNFAFTAKDVHGRSVRQPWAKERPAGLKPTTVEPPFKWFPTPYLSFSRPEAWYDFVQKLYWEATESKQEGSAVPCSKCGETVELTVFKHRERRLHVEWFEDASAWIADCPHCGRRHKWHLEDAVPARIHRQFPIAFKDRFTRALGDGLPLVSVGANVYCGAVDYVPARDDEQLCDADSRRGKLIPHRFKSEVTSERFTVYLPATARVLAKQGQVLDAGEVWAYGLHENPSESWTSQDRLQKWAQLAGVCGGPEYVGLLQQLWFTHQAVVSDDAPGQVLLPADLVGLAIKAVQPEKLYWDTMPSDAYMSGELDAIVFPPLRVHQWDNLRFSLPGEVAMDASIADPRFDKRVSRSEPRAPRRRQTV